MEHNDRGRGGGTSQLPTPQGALCAAAQLRIKLPNIARDARELESGSAQPYLILKPLFAGDGSGPPRPTARTSNVYLPGFIRMYFFGALQLENVGCWGFVLTSAHWTPLAAPGAPYLRLPV